MPDTREILSLIQRIQIQTTRLAKDYLSGMYRSAFKGRGMEFEEVREYQEGDDIRNIDWPVTSRMNHPYVKLFREERELTVMLLVDISASSRFGTGNNLKKDIITELSAILAFSAIKNNDNVGLILFSCEVEKYIPPRKSTRHVLRIIRELLLCEPKHAGTDISKALEFLGRIQVKSGVCFLISDFMSPPYDHQAALIALKHDLIGISISDPAEIELPQLPLVHMTDLETGVDAVIDMSHTAFKESFRNNAEERIAQQKQLLHSIGAGFIDIRTDQAFLPELQKFFKLRSRHPR